MGRDYTPTLEHYLTALSRRADGRAGCSSPARAWDSLLRDLKVAAIAAPLTAAIGLLTAYLLTRAEFRRPARLRVRHAC